MTKEQLQEFENYAFGIMQIRDYYSRAKIIELLVDKVNDLNETAVSVSFSEKEMENFAAYMLIQHNSGNKQKTFEHLKEWMKNER